MKSVLKDYELVMPATLQAALEMLAAGEGWRPLAGGTDIMVLLNAGKLPFRRLVSLRKLHELLGISVNETNVSIGAAVTYTQIQNHPVLQAEFPLLCRAASWTGGVANQNQGTIGGNIANASPAADSAPPLLAHDATVTLLSRSGSRSVLYSEFHLGYKTFTMGPEELLYTVNLPRRPLTWRFHARKVGTRRAQAISKVSIAAAASLEDGQIADIRLAFASVAPIPLRCRATERMLLGKAVSPETIANARSMLKSEITPISDIRSTAEYRSQVSQNLLAEFLETLR